MISPVPNCLFHVQRCLSLPSFRSITLPSDLLCTSSSTSHRNRQRNPGRISNPAPSPHLRFCRTADDASSVAVDEERDNSDGEDSPEDLDPMGRRWRSSLPAKGSVVVAACAIGLLTGVGVVLFNNAVHELRDFFWEDIPSRGTSWLREEPFEEIWQRVILVPVFGGVLVGMLNVLQNSFRKSSLGSLSSKSEDAVESIFKAMEASITLGTGNSLGPEGPSVEIGASIAKGVGKILKNGDEMSLAAAGSAAGISSGFNASVAGCFFAVESVLWPSPASASLTNSTSMVILSAVIASVVSELGLGPVPAFTVPDYDFRSPSELPLYLLLGILCGLVSLALTRCTLLARKIFEYVHNVSGLPKFVFPALGGLAVGAIALFYPEILYWGFENVDILLESQPFVKGLSTDILLQLVGAKIIATSLCRASGLVGGYYAPSLFIGAATGVAYGKFMTDIFSPTYGLFTHSGLELASPQAYGLVGMAATLSGVCQVPLTSVLLLFELTQDYRIVLPLLGAVGMSSWITSSESKGDTINKMDISQISDLGPSTSLNAGDAMENSFPLLYDDIEEVESSVHGSHSKELQKVMIVSEAMKTKYAMVLLSSSFAEAVNIMLIEKQSCIPIVDKDDFLIGLLKIKDLQEYCKFVASKKKPSEIGNLTVSEFYSSQHGKCHTWTVSPDDTLLDARRIMDLHGVSMLPVISRKTEDHKGGYLVGLLDSESIDIACRIMTTKILLGLHS